MKVLDTTALALILIGGLNWGLVGFFDYNLIDVIFGAGSVVARVIYAIVGVAALWTLVRMAYKPMMQE